MQIFDTTKCLFYSIGEHLREREERDLKKIVIQNKYSRLKCLFTKICKLLFLILCYLPLNYFSNND